jgi:hypothetical protein
MQKPIASSGSRPRLADHLASFAREPEQKRVGNESETSAKPKRPGTEVDLSQFGLGQR